MSRSLRATLVGVLVVATVVHAGTSQRVVRFADERLTVHAREVPLGDLLDELADATGAVVRGSADPAAVVSLTFDALPLAAGLERLLGRNSFALTYGRDGRLRAIELLGAGPATVRAEPAEPQLMILPLAFTMPFDNHPPIPIDGLLAAELGAKTATLRQLTGTAFHHPNSAVRAEAVRVTVRALEREPALRDSALGLFAGLDDATLARLLGRLGGARSAEVLSGVVRHARQAELRERAGAVLPHLADGPPAP